MWNIWYSPPSNPTDTATLFMDYSPPCLPPTLLQPTESNAAAAPPRGHIIHYFYRSDCISMYQCTGWVKIGRLHWLHQSERWGSQLLREEFLDFQVLTYHRSSTFSMHLYHPQLPDNDAPAELEASPMCLTYTSPVVPSPHQQIQYRRFKWCLQTQEILTPFPQNHQ